MDYLKVIKNDTFNISSNLYNPQEFDSHGYKARFKVSNGTLYLYCGRNSTYAIPEGETFEFVGKITFHGIGEVQYILFDKV